jgi:hypothetical protein
MLEWLDWLNHNAGVLTFGFFVATFLTLLETRAARLASTAAAHVAARPEPYVFVRQTYLKMRLRNHGPAVAEDVRLTLTWLKGGQPTGHSKALIEPVMGVGDETVYHPAWLLREDGDEPKIATLGDEGYNLKVEVSWLDERRRWPLWWVRVRTRQAYDLNAADYSESVHGGPLVLEKDTIREELEGINEHLKAMNDRATKRDMADWKIDDPGAQATLEHLTATHWLRRQVDLWKARWKVWTRRERN